MTDDLKERLRTRAATYRQIIDGHDEKYDLRAAAAIRRLKRDTP